MDDKIQPANPNLPLPKKGMPEWGPDYLEALNKTEGFKTKAAKLIGLSYSAVYKAALNYPDLASAVDEIRGEWDSRHLAELENLSMQQAMKPGCTTERIFNMKALNPGRYRDNPGPELPGNITIHFGAHIGGGLPETIVLGPDGKNLMEITADAAVQEIPSSTSRGRHSEADILSEDDVDLDI